MAIAAASADGKDVFGKNGLFDELKKALAERMRMAPRLMSSGGFGHLSKNDFMLSRSTAPERQGAADLFVRAGLKVAAGQAFLTEPSQTRGLRRLRGRSFGISALLALLDNNISAAAFDRHAMARDHHMRPRLLHLYVEGGAERRH